MTCRRAATAQQFRPAVDLPVISFVAEASRRPPEVASITCVSILETAADKLSVPLAAPAPSSPASTSRTRRSVRHLHDLRALHEHPADVAALAREAMLADAEAYGNQIPAYRENPMRETAGRRRPRG
jgi:hypothetical protein